LPLFSTVQCVCKFAGPGQGKEEIRHQIQLLRSTLTDVIDPNDSLLSLLLSKGVITYNHYRGINNKAHVREKSDELLRCLLDSGYSGDISEVMAIFEELGQQHVVNFIVSGGSMCVLLLLLSVS
jgi:hypothetical protein